MFVWKKRPLDFTLFFGGTKQKMAGGKDGFLDSRWVLHTQESGRLDAKRHYVILAKALDGIWPVGHACAVLCWGMAAVGAPAQHCTGMTNWPNTIQCLG